MRFNIWSALNSDSLGVLASASLLLAVASIVARAQQNAPADPPKPPTTADVQKLVRMIDGDKTKLRAYCDMSKVLSQLDRAELKNDSSAVKTFGAKADGLAQQLGPDYARIIDRLNKIDPNSPVGKRMNALLEPISKQCR